MKTGVKYLHGEAHKYDVGVYFEANGHGTVLFSKKFDQILKNWNNGDPNARDRLLAFSSLLNQATGDAISDMLAVESGFAHSINVP